MAWLALSCVAISRADALPLHRSMWWIARTTRTRGFERCGQRWAVDWMARFVRRMRRPLALPL